MIKSGIYSAFAICVFGSFAHATSFAPWREQVVADNNGKYYVVAKWKKPADKVNGVVVLTYAEGRVGSPAAKFAEAKEKPGKVDYGVVCDAAIQVRDGDLVHGKVELDYSRFQFFTL